MKNPSYLLVSMSLIFACMVLGVSLVSASSASTNLSSHPSSGQEMKFSQQIVPGHALYPMMVVRDKIRLNMLNVTDQCIERVALARERLNQGMILLERGESGLAVETFRKGHQYLAEASEQCQKEGLSEEYKANIIAELKAYRNVLLEKKDEFTDSERAIVGQVLAENDALLKHLGD